MSRISDVSSKLGQYMLTGWILTDVGCDVCSIPMLRSPAGQSLERLFCMQCQASPDVPVSSATGKGAALREPPAPSTASTSSTKLSRVSTPPTEVSSTLSSPTFAPPPDPQETMRRRAQSDLASAEIGRKMLRGWAMLGEECPNDSCYGVPLVRPPKPGGGKDPRKECVVCGRVYIFEKDSQGLDRLVLLNSTESLLVPRPVEEPTSQYEPLSAPDLPSTISQPITRNADNPQLITLSNTSEAAVHQSFPAQSVASNIPALSASITSLQCSLIILSNRLTALSGREPVDHNLIGDVASSMEKITNALRATTQLHYQEINRCAS